MTDMGDAHAHAGDVSARVLYSHDPAHKKRKRWKDGYLTGDYVKNGRVNVKLLDENGAVLSSRVGVCCSSAEDIREDDGPVCRCFSSGGFQLQFDAFCQDSDIPKAQVFGEKNGSPASRREAQEGATTSREGNENLPPEHGDPLASLRLAQRSGFNRPRQVDTRVHEGERE